MNKLGYVDSAALRDALPDASSVKAAKRLMIALAYAYGVRVDTLSERYVFRERRLLVARSVRTGNDQRGDQRRITRGPTTKIRRETA